MIDQNRCSVCFRFEDLCSITLMKFDKLKLQQGFRNSLPQAGCLECGRGYFSLTLGLKGVETYVEDVLKRGRNVKQIELI